MRLSISLSLCVFFSLCFFSSLSLFLFLPLILSLYFFVFLFLFLAVSFSFFFFPSPSFALVTLLVPRDSHHRMRLCMQLRPSVLIRKRKICNFLPQAFPPEYARLFLPPALSSSAQASFHGSFIEKATPSDARKFSREKYVFHNFTRTRPDPQAMPSDTRKIDPCRSFGSTIARIIRAASDSERRQFGNVLYQYS